MKKFLYLVLILIITIVTIFIAPLIYKNNKNNNEKEILGVWWWDNRIDNSYLDFAQFIIMFQILMKKLQILLKKQT